jgi:hypothetical protein
MTRAEVEALAGRIVLATMPRQQVDFEGRDAWLIAHPEAAADRKWIADRFRTLSRSLRWPETEQRAIRDWLTGVLTEAFGVEAALTVLRDTMAAAPDDASRLDLLRQVSKDYCLHCGKHIQDNVCYCMRDE